MLLAHGNMRVSHVTTHVALEDVPRAADARSGSALVLDLTTRRCAGLGIDAPQIAVAALNPHAGEGGLFGRQDIDVTAPTIADAWRTGIDVVGPVPGDTVFVKLRAGQYDAVVAMYHDQGHIPVKLLGFDVDPATGRWEALSGSTSRSACRSSAPRSTTAPPSTSPARASPASAACSRRSTSPRMTRVRPRPEGRGSGLGPDKREGRLRWPMADPTAIRGC